MRNKTILITGTSSGIGRATAEYFANQGCNVAATVRKKEDFFFPPEELHIKNFLLDVSDDDQCKAVVEDVIKIFGSLDVLVNNAGVAVIGAFEESSSQSTGDQFETNLFGPMRLSKYVLPHFRKERNGIIVTVTTMGARTGIPFYSVHAASKFAVEGFFESIRFELYPFNIKVKLIEPGSYKTALLSNGSKYPRTSIGNDYQPYLEKQDAMVKQYEHRGDPVEVAKAVWEAVADNSNQLRYVVGNDAIYMEKMRKELSDNQIFEMLGKNFINEKV